MRASQQLWTAVGFLLIVGSTACDTHEPVNEGLGVTGARALDERLIELITLDGQRGLSSFMLPHDAELQSIPQDALNPLTEARVRLGRFLFHETALARSAAHESALGTYSCATCHHVGTGFMSARRQAIGDGGVGWGIAGEARVANPEYAIDEIDVQPIRTATILNSAYQSLMLWDGSLGSGGLNAGTESRWLAGEPSELNRLGYDGLETQAIAGLSVHRMDRVEESVLATSPTYRSLWTVAFGDEPVTPGSAGLAIAAYERTVLANRAPFQQWLRGDLGAMTQAEKRGALLFFGSQAGCETCHTGPALNQMAFYALGMPDLLGPDVIGATPESLGRGGFTGDPAEYYKFKVPQLYNLADAGFLGHGSSFADVRSVIEYYNRGIPARPLPAGRSPPQFRPLGLTEDEIDDLVAFIEISLRDPELDRYAPSSLPSGACFPANDPAARADLGC